MKKLASNILGYSALLTGALLLGSGMMAGSYALYLKSTGSSPLDKANNEKLNHSLTRYMEQLQVSNNPRDIVVAVQFLDFHESGNQTAKPVSAMFVKQLKRAIAQSTDDSDIAWVEAMGCGRLEAACDPENAIARLKRLEPDNLAVYLLAFSRADRNGDAASRKAELAAMANSRYSDIHYYSTGNLYLESLRGWHSPMPISVYALFGDDINQAPVTDEESRKVVAAGYSLMMSLPPLSPLSEFCNSEQLPIDELQACQKIATLMVKDKTLIMHSVGLRIGLSVFQQEPEATQWRQAFRTHTWLNLYRPNKKSTHSLRDEMNAWPHEDEVAYYHKLRATEGISPTPPDGWQPDDKAYRKLLASSISSKQ
ncbi:MAG: hypothetical protein ACREPB_07675 [Arenimonas sp.]